MKKVFLVVSMLMVSALAFSQTAYLMEDVIDSEAVTYKQVAYLITNDLELVSPDEYEDVFVAKLEEKFPSLTKMSVKYSDVNSPISAKDLAWVISTAYDINTSLFFIITKAPRYAFKQFLTCGFYDLNTYPGDEVTGRLLLAIIGELSSYGFDGKAVLK